MFLESMLEFATLAKIKVDGMKATYDEDDNQLTLQRREQKNLDNTSEKVVIQIDKNQNSVLIKQEFREESNFEEIGNQEYSYDVFGYQKIIEIRINGKEMEMSTASVFQLFQEDTAGIGERYMIIFDTIDDMTNKNKWMGNIQEIEIEKKKYTVSQGYKVTDGTSKIGKLETEENTIQKIK